MTVAEVIQALRDADLQDDAETNIVRISVERAAFIKIRAIGANEGGTSDWLDEEDED